MTIDHKTLDLDAQTAYLAMAHDLACARMEVDGLRGEVAALADQLRRSRMELIHAAMSLQAIFAMSTSTEERDSARAKETYLEQWGMLCESVSDIYPGDQP